MCIRLMMWFVYIIVYLWCGIIILGVSFGFYSFFDFLFSFIYLGKCLLRRKEMKLEKKINGKIIKNEFKMNYLNIVICL